MQGQFCDQKIITPLGSTIPASAGGYKCFEEREGRKTVCMYIYLYVYTYIVYLYIRYI